VPFRIGTFTQFYEKALMAHFVGILAKEMLGINIEYVYGNDEWDLELTYALTNCRDWMRDTTCKKVVRGWTEARDAYTASQKKYPDPAPDVMWLGAIDRLTCCIETTFEGTDIIAVQVLGGIPSIPPSPLASFLSPSLHPPKLRLRVVSILQVDIQTKIRKIQEFTKIPGREKTDWGIETGS